jgi:hypothetical protein
MILGRFYDQLVGKLHIIIKVKRNKLIEFSKYQKITFEKQFLEKRFQCSNR